MFEYLIGKIKEKTPTYLVLDVNGVGFKLLIPLSTYEKLLPSGEIKFFAYLTIAGGIQEGDVRLFGFATVEEKQLFQFLITVNRVGPTMALRILSGASVRQVRETIVNNDIDFLARIKGVGPKTAQRLILELKESMMAWHLSPEKSSTETEVIKRDFVTDAVLALVSLGYARPTAEKAVRTALQKLPPESSVEVLVKRALQEA